MERIDCGGSGVEAEKPDRRLPQDTVMLGPDGMEVGRSSGVLDVFGYKPSQQDCVWGVSKAEPSRIIPTAVESPTAEMEKLPDEQTGSRAWGRVRSSVRTVSCSRYLADINNGGPRSIHV